MFDYRVLMCIKDVFVQGKRFFCVKNDKKIKKMEYFLNILLTKDEMCVKIKQKYL